MTVSVDYKLTGAGWAACTIKVDGCECTATASYLSDALGALLAAVNQVLSGEVESRCSFDEEPGEYRWIFSRHEDGRLSIRILLFDDLWSELPDAQGRTVLFAQCHLREFANSVMSTCSDLLKKYGLRGYEEKWIEHEFPSDEYDRLCQYLKAG